MIMNRSFLLGLDVVLFRVWFAHQDTIVYARIVPASSPCQLWDKELCYLK